MECFFRCHKTAGLDFQQSSFLDKTQASFKQIVSKASVQGDPLFLLKKCNTGKKAKITQEQILQQIVQKNAHRTEKEKRCCYSLYIGKCLENGISVQMDANQVYNYIQKMLEDETA